MRHLQLHCFLHSFLHPQCRSFLQGRTASCSNIYCTRHPLVACLFHPSYLWMEAQGLQLAPVTKHHQLGMQFWRALFTECSLPVRSHSNKMNSSKGEMRGGLSAKSLKAIHRSVKRSSTIPEYWKDYLSVKRH